MDSNILVIDNDRKKEMQMLDGTRRNFFWKNFSLIMSIDGYRKHIPLAEPICSLEHRIMYVNRGNTIHILNTEEHFIQAGELVLVPANFIFEIQHISVDFDAFILSFRILNIEDPGLIGYEILHTKLTTEGMHSVTEYFTLFSQIVQMQNPNGKDFEYLLTSFLYHIHQLHSIQNGTDFPPMQSRAKILQSKFMQLLVSQEVPVRNVSYYADKLNISEGYLQSVIRQVSGKPVMYWVNQITNNKIKALLRDKESNITLDAIADTMGLGNTSGLIRFFKRENNGITPAAYRNKSK